MRVCSLLTVASMAEWAEVEKEGGGAGARRPSRRSQEKDRRRSRLHDVDN